MAWLIDFALLLAIAGLCVELLVQRIVAAHKAMVENRANAAIRQFREIERIRDGS